MVGLDTNVLVRYLTQENAKQAAVATRLVDHELSAAQPGFVSLVVLVELCWVLKRLYAATEQELLATVADLLDAAQFQIERRSAVQAALQHIRSLKKEAGFTDVLIAQVALAEGCTHTLSFDKAAARNAGMQLLA